MAIFKDSKNNYFVGVLFLQSEGIYTGNFVRPSQSGAHRFIKVLPHFCAILRAVLFLAALISAVEIITGKKELYNYVFAFMGGLGTVAGVVYSAVLPLSVARSKIHLNNAKLTCLGKASSQMYKALAFVTAIVVISVISMPAFSFDATGIIIIFLLGPIFFLSVAGAILYAKSGNPSEKI